MLCRKLYIVRVDRTTITTVSCEVGKVVFDSSSKIGCGEVGKLTWFCCLLCRCVDEKQNWMRSEVGNKKLKDLGFEFEHGIDDIIKDTVSSCVQCGFISLT